MKKVISLVLAYCMLLNFTSVLAENNLNASEDFDIINSEIFTDENVIYNTQNNIVTFSSDNTSGIGANFDIVLGFDMSSNMYDYDFSGEMTWIDSFSKLSEQVPNETRFAVVTDEQADFGELSSSIDNVKNMNYSGTNNVSELFDNCISSFDSASDNRNKLVIATISNVSDVDTFQEEIEGMKEDGIIPFVFVLNPTFNAEVDDLDEVYWCTSDMQLRLAISDLYYALSEYKTASVSLYSTTSTDSLGEYQSDFREFNNFTDTTNKGALLASVLSIYGNVPLRATVSDTNSYDLISISDEKLEYFINHDNTTFSNGEELNAFYDSWNDLYEQLEGTTYIDTTTQVDTIIKNLKRKFPVVVYYRGYYGVVSKYNSNEERLYLKGSSSSYIPISIIDSECTVFDTFAYLMDSISEDKEIKVSAQNIVKSNEENVSIDIALEYPETYEMVDGEYPVEYVVTSVEFMPDASVDKIAGISLDNDQNPTILSIERSEDINTRYVLTSSYVTYINGLPNLCSANKMFRDLLYADEDDPSRWYYPYLFKLTNLGIISGDENRNFNENNDVTRAEFITMALLSAKIDVTPSDTDKHWAYNYIEKAIELELIDSSICAESELDSKIDVVASETLSRGEASNILCSLFIEKANQINVATNIYNYTEEFVSEKSKKWGKGEAFTDQNSRITQSGYADSIYQMYMNGVIEGFPNGEYSPYEALKRSQCSVIISKCLFDLDTDIETIQADIVDDYANSFDGEVAALFENVTQYGTMDTSADVDCFCFTPEETASYKIYSLGDLDIKGILYENDKLTMIGTSYYTLGSTYDTPVSENFKLARTLEKGTTYYIRVSSESGEKGEYSINVERYTEPTDAGFNNQWSLLNKGKVYYSLTNSNATVTPIKGKVGTDINVLPVWEYTKGAGVTVAVIDTGIETTHDDLSASISTIYSGYNFVHNNQTLFNANEQINPTGWPIVSQNSTDAAIVDEYWKRHGRMDINGHGTHVAGIIAAEQNNIGISGVAPESEIVPIKALGMPIAGNTSYCNDYTTLLNAIDYVDSNDIEIANISAGWGISAQDTDIIAEVREYINNADNTLFVVAAGNDGENLNSVSGNYPAKLCTSNMITVANINSDATLFENSNYGSIVHVAAPGTNIYSTIPINTFDYMTGTSMAAPHVAGVAALIKSYYPNLTVSELKTKIISPSNVTNANTLEGKVSSTGIVNAWSAFCNSGALSMLAEDQSDEYSGELEDNIKELILSQMNEMDTERFTKRIFVNVSEEYDKEKVVKDIVNNATIVQEMRLSGSLLLEFSSVEEAKNAVEVFNNDERVRYSEPVYTLELSTN